MKPIDKLFTTIDRVIEFLLFIVIMVMLCVGVAQIVARYVLHSSLSWSEELMRYLYVWMTMIGTSLAIRRNSFTVIDAIANLIRKKSDKAGLVLYGFITILQILFFSLLAVYGWQLSSRNFAQLSPAMRFPIGIAYLALPLGGVLGVTYTLISIRDYWLKRKEAKK